MFEATYRKILQVQKSVVEVKVSQSNISSKIENLKKDFQDQVSGMSGKIMAIEADGVALDTTTQKLCNDIEDIVMGVTQTEAQVNRCSEKVNKLETQFDKGTMFLKNLEEKEEDAKDPSAVVFARQA